ncbi:hypothetical protein KIW84_075677 [Lathyrus oleraceus]|uniref:Uncharacterized protein n=2 Tax=Pisum sativum TaxID=3888 RepID=A0A9D4VVT1_PEA|nr:hypothetical protein KIW84_075677 [Pisum sativum]
MCVAREGQLTCMQQFQDDQQNSQGLPQRNLSGYKVPFVSVHHGDGIFHSILQQNKVEASVNRLSSILSSIWYNSDENQLNEGLQEVNNVSPENNLSEDQISNHSYEYDDDQSDEDFYEDLDQLAEDIHPYPRNLQQNDHLNRLNEDIHEYERHMQQNDHLDHQWNGVLYGHRRNLQQNAIFEHSYRCFSVSSLDRPILECGDKIIMPASALERLARMNIEYPMLFELRNPSAEITTHCGVLEFTADEGTVSLPNWMMEDMLLQNGDIVSLKNTSLVKGKFVKLQPHSKDFLDITNPKAMLETSLRSYSCLTTGRTIMIPYNNKKYYIDVVETKPCPAISIIETDCEVDFAPPLDYKEPEKNLPSDLSDKESPQVEEEAETKTPEVIPFSGLGRRLDGKPATQSVEASSTPILKQQQQETENKTKSSGKVVFGSKGNAANVSLKNESQESPKKKTKTKEFQAFTGKKYSLIG